MRYTRYSTANDVMKEFLIYGAELTDMGFPILPAVQMTPSGTIDFRSGLNRSFKDHHNTSCNFYIDDEKFNCAYSMPDKYLNYLKLFQCVLGLDFSIDTQRSKSQRSIRKLDSFTVPMACEDALWGLEVLKNLLFRERRK